MGTSFFGGDFFGGNFFFDGVIVEVRRTNGMLAARHVRGRMRRGR